MFFNNATLSHVTSLQFLIYIKFACEVHSLIYNNLMTHWKRPWCWQRLKPGEGDDRGWDGWMASPTQWTWIWVNSGSWWWTGNPGMLQSMGLQRVRHDWATDLNWTEWFNSLLTIPVTPALAEWFLQLKWTINKVQWLKYWLICHYFQ